MEASVAGGSGMPETLMLASGGITGPGTIGHAYVATDEEVHA